LACKLGVVTGLGQRISFHVLFCRANRTLLDLASHCRLLFHNRSRHPKFCRWFILYPLYAVSEIAIISTDLAELLGSAIALNLLFPKLPLWGGVLLTAFDVLLILAFANPLHGRPVRSFELMIGILVCISLMIFTPYHILRDTGIGRVDMHVYPCFQGSSRVGWSF
jgi:NRAMP (natural resistance-associated macrophage protein)-like metal ion transporter